MLSRVSEVEFRWLAIRHFCRLPASAVKLWFLLLALSDDGGEIVRANITFRTLGFLIGLRRRVFSRTEQLLRLLASRRLLIYRRRPFSALLLIEGRPFKSLSSGLFVPPSTPFGYFGPAFIMPSKVRVLPPASAKLDDPGDAMLDDLEIVPREQLIASLVPLHGMTRLRAKVVDHAAVPGFSDDTGFRRFWMEYGRKEEKYVALLTWMKLGLSQYAEQIADAAKAWTEAGVKLPLPAEFLELHYWKSAPPVEERETPSLEERLAGEVSRLLLLGGIPDRMLERYVREMIQRGEVIPYDAWLGTYRSNRKHLSGVLRDGMALDKKRSQGALGRNYKTARNNNQRLESPLQNNSKEEGGNKE